eukprot:scaffold43078_cov44-Tisochrysis_lutea.AAC.2
MRLSQQHPRTKVRPRPLAQKEVVSLCGGVLRGRSCHEANEAGTSTPNSAARRLIGYCIDIRVCARMNGDLSQHGVATS